MIIATVTFAAGSCWYKIRPPKSNVFKDVAVVIKKAIGNKMRSHGAKKDHWLDHALTSHRCETSANCQIMKRRKGDQSACAEAKFVDDVKSLFRVLIMYVPLPVSKNAKSRQRAAPCKQLKFTKKLFLYNNK